MDKFTTNVQVEEDKAYQEWLDAQEVADVQAFAKSPPVILGQNLK